MFTYEVTLEVTSELASSVGEYMQTKHIPEIFLTGCFTQIAFEQAGSTKFRTRYQAPTAEALDRYLRDHSASFRTDFLAHFPAGVTVSRERWETRKEWGKR